LAMIDLLVKDLDKETTEAETEEKDSQAEYEQLMTDSLEKRTVDCLIRIQQRQTWRQSWKRTKKAKQLRGRNSWPS